MSTKLLKVNSIEELNQFLTGGKVIYSIANAGNVWFVEYDDESKTTSSVSNTEDRSEELIEKFIRLGYIVQYNDHIETISEYGAEKLLNCLVCENEATRRSVISFINAHSYCSIDELNKIYKEISA